jgi:hypothetical protein
VTAYLQIARNAGGKFRICGNHTDPLPTWRATQAHRVSAPPGRRAVSKSSAKSKPTVRRRLIALNNTRLTTILQAATRTAKAKKPQPAKRGAKVYVVSQADEGHSERCEFGQRVDQVLQGPPKAFDLPNQNCVKPSTASV